MIDTTFLLTQAERLPVESFDWGTLCWLANGQLFPGARQTLGVCHLLAGKGNPPHYHPNCEELLYVLEGHGKHRLEDCWVAVQPGTTVRIPAGMKHQLINEGKDALITVIAFSSADRQTVFLE